MSESEVVTADSLLEPAEQDQIQRLRDRIGMRLDDANPYRGLFGQRPFYTAIHRDGVHNFAWGIDDMNPLWVDPAYGVESSAGHPLAPPSFLLPLGPAGLSSSLFRSVGEVFGEHGTWGGVEFNWLRPLRVGLDVDVASSLAEVLVKRSRLAGVMVKMMGRTEYRDGDGGLLATAHSWVFRRRHASYGSTVIREQLTRWTPAELAAVRAEQLGRRRRGPEPRWWGEVAPGDTFDLVKGPYSLAANICFLGAWHNELHGRGDIPWAESGDWPAGELGYPQSVAGTGHYEAAVAQSRGLPGPYDYGPQRVAWAVQAVTDWAGDHAFVESLRFEVRGYNFIGDLQRFHGRVRDLRVEDGRHLVDLDLSCTNQLGETTGVGSAVVRLPVPDGSPAPSLSGRDLS